MKIKFQKENILGGMCMMIFIILFFPFIAFLSPSVSEATNVYQKECSAIVNGTMLNPDFQPCLSMKDAFKINSELGLFVGILGFLFIIFIKFEDEQKQISGEENE